MKIIQMRQSEAIEIADCWKYDGEYAFYDMTADPEDYEELVTPEKRGDRYFSVFEGNGLTGFFCVEQDGADIALGLGLRPDLTGHGRGKAFLAEIIRFVRENYTFDKIRLDVASFNQRAIKVYERAGFVKTGTARIPTNGGVYNFTLMEMKQSMKTKLLTEHDIAAAAAILRDGGLLGIPTETVYGLGADGLNAEAVRRIFEAKGRPQDNPLILHVPDAGWLDRYCHDVPPAAYTLAEKFWPGPLTMILPRRKIVPDAVTCGLDTVGVRCPGHPITLAIIRAANLPIAAPSGNLSGRPSPTCARHMLEDMEGRVDAIVDGGPCGVGVESTIIDLTSPLPRLLRPGGLPLEALEAVLGEVAVDKAVLSPLTAGEAPKAPGMKYRHYAPKAPVTVVTGVPARTARYIRENMGEHTGVICFDEYAALFAGCAVRSIGSAADPESQARRVFDALRFFDGTDVTAIYAQCPGDAGLGLAVANRLKKAAGFRTVVLGKEEP